MGLIDRLFGRESKITQVINAGQTLKLVGGYEPAFRTWNGEIYESMLVRAAIDARARHASKLKADIIGSAKPDLCARLKKRPNPWNTWSQFLYRVCTMLDVNNNVLLVPIYDNSLNKIGFFPVLPKEAKILEYKDEYWIRYKFLDGRKTAACRLNECALLTKFQYKNDFFGESNFVLDDTLDLISIEKQGIKEAIKSTAAYRFMATLTNFSKVKDLEKEREEFTESSFGPEAKKKNGLLLFPNTYKDVKQIETKNYTVDKDQMELINNNVYTYFGVNADVLQNKANGDAWSAFYEGAIEPFAIQISETLTCALFSDREQSFGAKVQFTANRLAYMNFRDKLEYVQGMVDRGMIMIDEGREVFNLAPLPDGQGQRFVRRGEYHFNDEAENLPTEGNNDNN